VVNKPVNLLTSTVPREPRPTLLKLVREHCPGHRVGLIHRLDKDVSGLLVFSKTDLAYRALKAALKRREIERIYLAIVSSRPPHPKAVIHSRLLERTDGTVVSVKHGGEPASTHYTVLRSDGTRSLLRVRLETGRKHQIRVHLAEMGCPVVNDPLYGNATPSGRMMLHGAELAFAHPVTGAPLKFTAALPREMKQILPGGD
jgi:23S rRNA pseudouridine1911/1915/1917 synthase